MYPRKTGPLWIEFERRHRPEIATRRISELLPEDVSGNFPQQFSERLDLEKRVWYKVQEYTNLSGQALKEYHSLATLQGYSLRRTADYLISIGYDADEVERVYQAAQVRYMQTQRRAEEYLDQYGED